MEIHKPMRYGRAASFARVLARKILDVGLPREVYLNVNVPGARRVRGVVFARQGKRIYHDGVEARPGQGGAEAVYSIGGYPEWDEQPGSDFAAFRSGYITITPLRVDLTDARALSRLSHWRFPASAPPKRSRKTVKAQVKAHARAQRAKADGNKEP
jgi:5'-nucleotidase